MQKRAIEITKEFNSILDNHLEKIIQGKVDDFLEIHDVAEMMHIHPTHLSNTIKETTGKSPCDICNEKTINIAKHLLSNPEKTISDVAFRLTFDPSNFSKYFKKHTGKTPTAYRNSETLTSK